MISYELTGETYGVQTLTAPYALLVEAFGNDGINPHDTDKSMCQWESNQGSVYAAEDWEVYDYKVGTCYRGEGGQEREEITEWHVQATGLGRAGLIELLDAAARRLNGQAVLEHGEAMEELYRKANGEGVEQEEINALVDELGDGGTVRIGEQDEDGFFTGAGLEISLEGVRAGVAEYEHGERAGDVTMPLSLDEVRKAHALLGAYLAIVDQDKS